MPLGGSDEVDISGRMRARERGLIAALQIQTVSLENGLPWVLYFSLFFKFQHIRIAVAAAGVLEVHQLVVHFNNQPVFLQFGKRAGRSADEIDQEFVFAVVIAAAPGTRPGLGALSSRHGAVAGKIESISRKIGRFISFVVEVSNLPNALCGHDTAAWQRIVAFFTSCKKQAKQNGAQQRNANKIHSVCT